MELPGAVDLYPTKASTIRKMLDGVKLDQVGAILEPGAGWGNICDYIKGHWPDRHGRRGIDLDVIELAPECQHVLRGKGYRLIHDDFLTFQTYKSYGLIIANFPFSAGDQHLRKALSILERGGGTLRCLVNAQTILNPYTKLRQSLVRMLERFEADIEYLQDEFKDAERQASVEVALIKLSIERDTGVSVILDSLDRAREEEEGAGFKPQALVDRDYKRAFVARFNLECSLGTRLIDEWLALEPYILDRIKRPDEDRDYSSPLIKLDVKGAYASSRTAMVNAYLRGQRSKYWELLIHDRQFTASFTSNILNELSAKLEELKDYDFNLFNIAQLERELRGKIVTGIEESILKLFDTFTRKYAFDESLNEGNIHYYNGWKTNKAHKVGKKIIIPMYGYSAYGGTHMEQSAARDLRDMVKVFNYLSADKIDVPQLVGNAIHCAERRGHFRGMDMRYFEVDVFKKQTCHVKFRDQRLLDKFNIFGSQRKGWLPPAYGKKPYEDMNAEERAVIDSFQGKEKYAEVMREADYYLVDASGLLLCAGLAEGADAPAEDAAPDEARPEAEEIMIEEVLIEEVLAEGALQDGAGDGSIIEIEASDGRQLSGETLSFGWTE